MVKPFVSRTRARNYAEVFSWFIVSPAFLSPPLCVLCKPTAAVGVVLTPPASLGQEVTLSSELNLVSAMSPDLRSF